ncbi:pre-mRNA-splicing factor CWC21 [Paraphaeosphaeria minitans]|uniref:Pre-mRNA-splicing factor CWC21 n=1 Tax=Paraphaeosphaeria minitans TaxID=565426 RepID=A0A9P6GBH6_9PLEO|nr:pre-mRNA-splicing factor CWC21 [Paraphaeosphaeria minitans]
MSSNVGLSTPRGSGTSGYVQKNRSLLKPRDKAAPYSKDWDSAKHRQRQPDPEILEHDRKREIEVKVLELRDKLEDEGLDEDEIDDRCDGLRKKLEEERTAGKGAGPDARSLKSHQVHDLAQVSDPQRRNGEAAYSSSPQAKIEESERLRKALGISADYEEGSHWRKQEERLRESLAQREREDEDQLQKAKEARRYRDDSE